MMGTNQEHFNNQRVLNIKNKKSQQSQKLMLGDISR